ncbi:hypothetical protein [Trichothermofontia sp.]
MSTRIGELLQTAGLVSQAQIEVAIRDQTQFPNQRLGEILALRGWVKPETVEFLLYLWPKLLNQPKRYPLGYYLKASGLLKDEQIQMLLKEQEKTGIRLGALAVLHGWLKQDTVTFFLQHLNPQALAESAFVAKRTAVAAQARSVTRPTRQSQPIARSQPTQVPHRPQKPATPSLADSENLDDFADDFEVVWLD